MQSYRVQRLSWLGWLWLLGLLGLFTDNRGWFGFFGFIGWFSLARINVDERYEQNMAKASSGSYLITTIGLVISIVVVALTSDTRLGMQVVAGTFVVHILSLVALLHYYDWRGN